MGWKDRSVLVTGGASFIGSHLINALVEAGARVGVVDNLSSGKLENIKHHEAASCRYVTVFGPLGHESHAIIAMIARAFIGQNPFEVWGAGNQVRNWTYIDDIVRGTMLAAERINDGTAINLGTMERVRVIDAVKMVWSTAATRPRSNCVPIRRPVP